MIESFFGLSAAKVIIKNETGLLMVIAPAL
jgi:hypothetical protein